MTIHHLIDGNMLLTVSNNNKHYRLELNKNGTCIAMTTDYNDNYKHEYIQGDIKECLDQLTIYPKCLSGYRLEQEYRSLAQHIDIVTSLNFVGGLKPNVITIGFDGAMFANWRDFVASDILKNKYCLAQETHYQALAS